MKLDNAVSLKKGSATAVTKSSIERQLRRQIVEGEFAPGTRLPTHSDLIVHFGTTKVTVQRALDTLSREGFITTDGRRGTFVSKYPPHTSRYAIVFPDPLNENWSGFYHSLREEALRMDNMKSCKTSLFYAVGPYSFSVDSKRLLYEMQTYQLAGVIFAYNPEMVASTPLMQVLDVPMVAIMDRSNRFGVPVVKIDYHSFFSRALEALAQQGRKRVAAISPVGLRPEVSAHFFKSASKYGFQAQPHWWLPVHLDAPEIARSYIRLLMNQHSKTRPDALIISDDQFVDEAMMGLQEMNIRVPQDIQVVAHGNFPISSPARLPIQRLGYSSQQVLSTCLDLIDRQRSEKTVPSLTAMKAVFENELSGRIYSSSS